MPKPVSDITNTVQLESNNLCGCDAVLVNLIKSCRHFTGTSLRCLCDKLVTVTTSPENFGIRKGNLCTERVTNPACQISDQFHF